MLIYFDLCALQRLYDDQSQPRVQAEAVAVQRLLDHCRTGGGDLASSDALALENDRNPHAHSRSETRFRLATAAVYQPVTGTVSDRANALVAAGLRPLDALHMASAEAAGADYLCTCDDQLLRRGRVLAMPPLRVRSPVELVTELGL